MSLRELVGVHHGMPASEYHGLGCASASILRRIWAETPAHARLAMLEPVEPTAEMMIGTLAHAAILEPEKPLPGVAIRPETYDGGDGPKPWSGNAKACRAWLAEQKAAGNMVLTQSQLGYVAGIIGAIKAHPIASKIVAGAQTEVSCIAWERGLDLGVRCRLDIVPEAYDTLADIKTTTELRGWGEKKAYNDGLHIQAALYLMVWNSLTGEKRTQFQFIAVENSEPFDIRVFQCSREFLEAGREDALAALRTFAECEKTGTWPASPAKLYTLNVPKWRANE